MEGVRFERAHADVSDQVSREEREWRKGGQSAAEARKTDLRPCQ